MSLFNSGRGYGGLTKFLHWSIALLFALQYVSATIMVRTAGDATALGLSQSTFYNWHKSLGLVALAMTVVRLANRRVGELPPWAPTLSTLEQAVVHRAEQLLYAAMLIMPVSGFVYVMAGGYGVRLFGVVDLVDPIGASPLLASAARWTHAASAILLLLPLGVHLGIVVSHHVILKDGLITRMLPTQEQSCRQPRDTDRGS